MADGGEGKFIRTSAFEAFQGGTCDIDAYSIDVSKSDSS